MERKPIPHYDQSAAHQQYQMNEMLKEAQIARNNEWIEKMSPIIKYKIQEYVRKQKTKRQQRRKFSIANGLMSNKTKIVETLSSGTLRKRTTKRVISEGIDNKYRGGKKDEYGEDDEGIDNKEDVKKQMKMMRANEMMTKSVTNRRKSAPPQRVDLRDLDDLE